MSIPQAYFEATPPSIDGPWLYAFSIFGLLGAALLTAEWLWRTVWAIFEKPSPMCHPISVARAIWALVLGAMMIYILPDVLLTIMWTDIAAEQRYQLSRANRLLDGVAIFPFFGAWLLGIVSASVIEFQLERRPIPVDLWPTWQRLRRPLAIGAIILTMSIVIAFRR